MSGKRIAREKMTIQRMISLYESQCPQASRGITMRYLPMRKSASTSAYLVRKNRPVNSVLCTVINLLNAKR